MRRRGIPLPHRLRRRKPTPYEQALADELRRTREHAELMNRAETIKAEAKRDRWYAFGG
jgi:hypothetical protein